MAPVTTIVARLTNIHMQYASINFSGIQAPDLRVTANETPDRGSHIHSDYEKHVVRFKTMNDVKEKLVSIFF